MDQQQDFIWKICVNKSNKTTVLPDERYYFKGNRIALQNSLLQKHNRGSIKLLMAIKCQQTSVLEAKHLVPVHQP